MYGVGLEDFTRSLRNLALYWVLVRGLNLSYHNQETILFTIDSHCGNLNKDPLTRTQFKALGFGVAGLGYGL